MDRRTKNLLRIAIPVLLLLVLAPSEVRSSQLNEHSKTASSTTSAPDAKNVELVGQTGGLSYAVAVGNSYAYLSVGLRLRILDVSDPTSPTLVGQTAPFPDIVRDVAVAGGYAYVADSSAGLRVVDISTPSSPAEVGYYDTSGGAVGVDISGDYAYVADGGAGLRVVNVLTPSNPTEVGYCDTPGSARGIALAGDYAYVADDSEGLRVVNVLTPTNPTEVGFEGGSARGVFVNGGYAYVVGNGGMKVVDVSTPTNPTILGVYSIRVGADNVAVAGNYAYLTSGSQYPTPELEGLRVIDISNPTNPEQIGSYAVPGYAYDVNVSGNRAYIASLGGGLRVMDISEPADPAEIGSYEGWWYVQSVAVSGDYAYLPDYTNGNDADGGFHVVDVSVPSDPREVGYYKVDVPPTGLDVVVSGDYAYVADLWELQVMDISSPTAPTQVDSFDKPSPWYPTGVDVSENCAYISTGSGLSVMDTSDPSNLVEIGFYALAGTDVAVAGDYAYYGTSKDPDLRVIDISDPTNPTEVGIYENDLIVYPMAIAIAGDYAYVVDGWLSSSIGLGIVDISIPENPITVSSYGYGLSASFRNVTVVGNYAYVVGTNGSNSWLRVIDISDPVHPVEVGWYNNIPGGAHPNSINKGRGYGVAVNGNYVYVANYAGGLFIFRILALQTSYSAVTFITKVDEADPPPYAVDIRSTAHVLTYTATVSPTVPWLDVTPLTSTTPSAITVTAHTSGLGLGQYETALIVESEEDVIGSPQTIPITLIVAEEVHDWYSPRILRE